MKERAAEPHPGRTETPVTGHRELVTAGGQRHQGQRRSTSPRWAQLWGFPWMWAQADLAILLPRPDIVDCRIQTSEESGITVVTIAGRLMSDHIPSLLTACANPPTVRLDLKDVLSVDAIAAEALRRLRDGGADVIGAPIYIQLKLDSVPPRPRPL